MVRSTSAHAKDLGSVPSTQTPAHNYLELHPDPGDPKPSSGPPWEPGMNVMSSHRFRQNTQTHTAKTNESLKTETKPEKGADRIVQWVGHLPGLRN